MTPKAAPPVASSSSRTSAHAAGRPQPQQRCEGEALKIDSHRIIISKRYLLLEFNGLADCHSHCGLHNKNSVLPKNDSQMGPATCLGLHHRAEFRTRERSAIHSSRVWSWAVLNNQRIQGPWTTPGCCCLGASNDLQKYVLQRGLNKLRGETPKNCTTVSRRTRTWSTRSNF